MKLACPAASPITPLPDGESVLCGVLELSNEGAANRGFQERGKVSPVISGQHDAATVQLFCCGDGSQGSPACYVHCQIWRAQREAEWAARSGPDALRDEAHREYAQPPTPELV